MSKRGLPAVGFLLICAIVIGVIGGILLLVGYRTSAVAIVLFAYLIPVTLVFHNFWASTGMGAQMQVVNFLKNLSIMGGLLTLAVTSTSPVSVDAARERRHPRRAVPT
jgi:putative oxidoreductase